MEIDNADRAFTDIAVAAWVLQLQGFDGRDRLSRGIRCQLTESEMASAGGMDHFMIDRLHLGNRHAPSLGGGGFQHGTR